VLNHPTPTPNPNEPNPTPRSHTPASVSLTQAAEWRASGSVRLTPCDSY
jgi:hypothetical protein